MGVEARIVELEENPDLDLAPPSLINIIGKKFLFIVTVNQMSRGISNRNFTVNKIMPVPPEHTTTIIERQNILSINENEKTREVKNKKQDNNHTPTKDILDDNNTLDECVL